MQPATVGSDVQTKYIEGLRVEFFKLQNEYVETSKENFLKTQFILSNNELMEAYVDYLSNLTTIEDNYMQINEEDINEQIESYDVTDKEINDYWENRTGTTF